MIMDPHFNKYQTKRKNRKVRIKIYLISAGLLLLLIGIFYVIQLSPVFRVRNFKISGREHLSDSEVLEILEPLVISSQIKTFLGKDNMLSWNMNSPDTSKTALLEASISRDWIRQSVDISIKERDRIAIWCDSAGDCSWIDDDGMFFEKAPQVEGSLILTIFDANAGYIRQGEKISEDRFIGNIIKIINGLKDLRLAVKKINFDSRLEEIRVQSYSGPDIYLSIRFDPDANINSLRSLIEKNGSKNYRYIDLRVENRIYYKTS